MARMAKENNRRNPAWRKYGAGGNMLDRPGIGGNVAAAYLQLNGRPVKSQLWRNGVMAS